LPPWQKDNLVLPPLERIAQRKLNQPRRPHGARDFAEGAVSSSDGFHIRHRGAAKVGVIPNIEKVRGEPQCLPLCQFEILDEREVPILLMRPAKRISAQVPEVGRAIVRVWQNNGAVENELEFKYPSMRL